MKNKAYDVNQDVQISIRIAATKHSVGIAKDLWGGPVPKTVLQILASVKTDFV